MWPSDLNISSYVPKNINYQRSVKLYPIREPYISFLLYSMCVTIKRFTKHTRQFSKNVLLQYTQSLKHLTITGPTKKTFFGIRFFCFSHYQQIETILDRNAFIRVHPEAYFLLTNNGLDIYIFHVMSHLTYSCQETMSLANCIAQ